MFIYGILCEYTDFKNMADFLNVHQAYFSSLLSLKNGTPSHDTLSRVFSVIDSKSFLDIFITWINEIIEDNGIHISIDDKAVKTCY